MPSPTLAELQAWMRGVVVDPRGAGPAVRDPGYSGGLEWISQERGIDSVSRLDVYAEAYFSRLSDALAVDYPELKKAFEDLEENGFLRLAASYLAEHPSRSPNITDAGAALPDFLPEYLSRRGFENPTALVELARLEWARIESFYAPHLPPFDPAQLAKLTPEDWARATLVLCPSMRFVESRGSTLVTFRQGQALGSSRVETADSKPAEAALLKLLARGLSLSDALSDVELDAPASLQGWFARWTSLGWIRGIVVN